MKRFGFAIFVVGIWLGFYVIQINFWRNPIPVQNLSMRDSVVLPNLVVQEKYIPSSNPQNPYKPYKKKYVDQQAITVDINTADTNMLKLLPGIGPYRAKRITTFREALGGFTSVDQVAETYGLPDSIFQNIKQQLIFSKPFVKIKINQLPYDSLYPHPYITKQMAYYIMKYRREKGDIKDFNSLEQLLDKHHREMLLKLKPYLDFGIYTD